MLASPKIFVDGSRAGTETVKLSASDCVTSIGEEIRNSDNASETKVLGVAGRLRRTAEPDATVKSIGPTGDGALTQTRFSGEVDSTCDCSTESERTDFTTVSGFGIFRAGTFRALTTGASVLVVAEARALLVMTRSAATGTAARMLRVMPRNSAVVDAAVVDAAVVDAAVVDPVVVGLFFLVAARLACNSFRRVEVDTDEILSRTTGVDICIRSDVAKTTRLQCSGSWSFWTLSTTRIFDNLLDKKL
ncbi:hypothetical protein GNI_045710 [Gregarina niphandrodes]|uniref:Uncharacterized protein n=1 Tax=Gregarina niphandrodes TaxID=110365 RepID=A0A023B9W8_GRENI|nr:hypothetical protein GNI_045710 [Gregarina niphandrodes]EZG76061.1 hypothetical protein GNI_045710 [Gregarina niphandrodes]|eukprot:XP_011129595.1 hypothetical protein GNI_045710 [Gregarina niphandrodes]